MPEPKEHHNHAPFNWSNLTDKIVYAGVAFLFWWGWQANERINRIENFNDEIADMERSKTIFWQIHSQQRAAHNDLVDALNDRREPGEEKLPRLVWDINPDEDN